MNMNSAVRRIRVLGFLACWLGIVSAQPTVVAASDVCRTITHEDNPYTVCQVDLHRHSIRLFWKRPDGAPYAHLNALPQIPSQRSGPLIFATNAGMFDPAYKPVGLYVENGRELVHANIKAGGGNFHLRPNGIFYVAGERAGVLETRAYLKQSPHSDIATQSGPMLVIDGHLHPLFVRANVSLKRRSGVGVRDASTVLFALSGNEVSFAAFARFFRDRLKCDNALFLDGGSVPSLYAPSFNRDSNLLSLGPMIGVYEKSANSRTN